MDGVPYGDGFNRRNKMQKNVGQLWQWCPPRQQQYVQVKGRRGRYVDNKDDDGWAGQLGSCGGHPRWCGMIVRIGVPLAGGAEMTELVKGVDGCFGRISSHDWRMHNGKSAVICRPASCESFFLT